MLAETTIDRTSISTGESRQEVAMGLQRRTAIAALAIQRRIAEALNNQPNQAHSRPQIQREWQQKLLGYQSSKSAEIQAQDRQLVRIFQQNLGLLTRAEEPSAKIQTQALAPMLSKLKARALQHLSKDNQTQNSQSNISGEYESLTDELIRVSDYLGHTRQTLATSEPTHNLQQLPRVLLPEHSRSTWQVDDDSFKPSINCFRIKIRPLLTDEHVQASKQLSQQRLTQPPTSLDEYRLRIQGIIDQHEIAPKQAPKQADSRHPSPFASLKRLVWQSRQEQANTSKKSLANEITDDYQQSFYLSLLNS